MGFLNPFLYQNARAFTDITVGNNVVNTQGNPIPGLYATGNCTAGLLTTYPGPGATLGPAMTFGYIAGKAMAEGDAVDLQAPHEKSDPA